MQKDNRLINGRSGGKALGQLEQAVSVAIENAILASVPGRCSKCAESNARSYAFAYAKLLSSSTGNDYGGYTATTTNTYGPVLAIAVNLCDRCISQYASGYLKKSRTTTIVSGAIAVVLTITSIFLPKELREIMLGLAILPTIIFIAFVVKYNGVKTNIRLAGSMLAIELYEDDLKKQGFSYWLDEKSREKS